MNKKNAWEKYPQQNKNIVFEFSESYKTFISDCKTERECISWVKKQADAAGFLDLNTVIKDKKRLKAGDKVYVDNMGKSMALFTIGKQPLEMGMNILGAHVDSPRLDLKQNPIYEDTDLVLLDTHYYGGVKKYQWVTLPLAIHGILIKKDGTKVEVNIGDKEDDPVFGISDLLIHLSSDQLEKKASKVIEGENLDVLIASIPFISDEDDKESKCEAGDKELKCEAEDKAEDREGKADNEKGNSKKGKVKDAVKVNVLNILKEQYDIEEEDFLSAEIELVPAGKARDYGIDRSMVMGYGHDDRVCAFPSFMALLEVGECEKTSVCLLVDKEEVGSVGATGMHSKFFEYAVAEILNAMDSYSQITFNRAMNHSNVLSSDVSAAFDPLYPSVMEKKNAAYFGKGLVFNKYTGARGKSNCNDANPEYMANLRRIMEEADVSYQTSELGKVDQGGGGTIAYILANYNMQVIDSGIAVLNMHAPWEIISKVDLYEAKKGYAAFLKEA
ncbi:aminopeptidase [Lachnospiraceae bacterium ZAX-1]